MEIIKRDRVKPLVSERGENVRELASPSIASLRRHSLAEVTIVPGGCSARHYHRQAEEVYYILQGQGQMIIDDEVRPVGPGDTIIIPPPSQHLIRNIGVEELVMVVTCAPAWSPEDEILVGD
ncbi:MAG: cupin domain-containing protein [Anaerolineae bacterium]|jgi:mannose-6-phosphate isomerase-like protein (cupin superfamily)|nr:cupin domain-containing protein [Anaerolineae bacterium]MDH7474798.1 cupin domain-containing protein [Anaerolineae bacterium]